MLHVASAFLVFMRASRDERIKALATALIQLGLAWRDDLLFGSIRYGGRETQLNEDECINTL